MSFTRGVAKDEEKRETALNNFVHGRVSASKELSRNPSIKESDMK